jgi:hypothetical protein
VSELGICAERCAIDHAVLHSNKKIQKIALVMSGDRQGQPKPCGPYLQYIHDFAKNAKQKVIMSQAKKKVESSVTRLRLNLLQNCCFFPMKNDKSVVVKLKNERSISKMILMVEGWEGLSGSDV